MIRFKCAIALLTAATLTTACSDDKKSKGSGESDSVKYDIKLDLKPSSTYDLELTNFAKAINAGKSVSHNLMTKKLKELHVKAYKTRPNTVNLQYSDLDNFVSDISQGLSKDTNYFLRKSEYENKMEEYFGAVADYNKDMFTLGDVAIDNKLQCYSGTSLNLAVNRQLEAGSRYESNNYVVIFEPGHVLTGKMLKQDDEWRLIGIETTSTGHATRDFGYASQLKFNQVRVVDAGLYVVTEVFKPYLKTPIATANDVLETTAKKYGIPLNRAAARTGAALSHPNDDCGANLPFGMNLDQPKNFASLDLNFSPFGFGCSKAPSGDVKRSHDNGIGVDFTNGKSIDVESLLPKEPQKADEKIREEYYRDHYKDLVRITINRDLYTSKSQLGFIVRQSTFRCHDLESHYACSLSKSISDFMGAFFAHPKLSENKAGLNIDILITAEAAYQEYPDEYTKLDPVIYIESLRKLRFHCFTPNDAKLNISEDIKHEIERTVSYHKCQHIPTSEIMSRAEKHMY